MKKIKVVKWKEKTRSNGSITEVETNTIIVLNILVTIKSRQENGMPKGMDSFRLMNRVGRAFDEAEKSGVLKLEEGDYDFLKKAVENDIPSEWGMQQDTFKAIETFLKAGDV